MGIRRAAILLLAAAACDSRALGDLFDPGTTRALPESFSERSRNTLFVGRASDALGLDPARFSENESVEVCEQIFDHLVRYREGSTDLEPALATSWTLSEDGR